MLKPIGSCCRRICVQAILAGFLCAAVQPLVAEDKDSNETVEPLEAAIRDLDADAVRKLIDAGEDVNQPGTLVFAVTRKNAEIVRMLVEGGANVNTPIQIPAEQRKELLDKRVHGPDSHVVPGTPLSVAALMGHSETVEVLLEAGANPNIMTYTGSPIYLALAKGDIASVTRLIEAGANVSAIPTGRLGAIFSPLLLAVKNGDTTVIELLVELGAYPCADHSTLIRDSRVLDYQIALRYMAEQTGKKEVIAMIDLAGSSCNQ